MSQTSEKSIIETPQNQTEKITSNENYIPYSLLKDIITPENKPDTVLGCWITNHKFNGVKKDIFSFICILFFKQLF